MNDTTDIDGEAVALQAFTLTDDAGNGYTYYKRNRQISLRIKRPPSQRISNEMAVSIFIMV